MTSTKLEAGWIARDDTFGARLALIRQRMHWGNTKEAALACGLPVQSWRNWERDGRMPRDYLTACQKIAERTGADVWWLAGMDQPPPRRDQELPRLDSNQEPSGYPVSLGAVA